MKTSRNPAMDVIRIFAFLTVVMVHFFLNSGFYEQPVLGTRMVIMLIIRTFAMICVPLFMILSGYLMKNKKISREYYLKIFRTLGIYLLASIACAVYDYITCPEGFSFFGSIVGIFGFTTCSYSWYINMYIGLFLIIPFINILWNGLREKKQKQLLILTMVVLTALPQVINGWQLFSFDWWLNPSSSTNYDAVFPSFWTGIYPITYYFIGCYLREFPLKIKKITNAGLIAASAVVFGLILCYRRYGGVMLYEDFSGHGSLITLIQSVLVFNFLASFKYSSLSAESRGGTIGYISQLTLGAYLVSELFDDLFYGILKSIEPDICLRFNYFIPIVLAVSISSLGLSAVIDLIYSFSAKGGKKLYYSVFKRKEKA